MRKEFVVRKVFFISTGFLLTLPALFSHATTFQPIGSIIKTCSIDLNKDGKKDIATLYEKQN